MNCAGVQGTITMNVANYASYMTVGNSYTMSFCDDEARPVSDVVKNLNDALITVRNRLIEVLSQQNAESEVVNTNDSFGAKNDGAS